MKKSYFLVGCLSLLILSCSKSDESISETPNLGTFKTGNHPPRWLAIDMGGKYHCPTVPMNCTDPVVITPKNAIDQFRSAVVNGTISSYLENNWSAFETQFPVIAENYKEIIEKVIDGTYSMVYRSPSVTVEQHEFFIIVPTSKVGTWDIETDVILAIDADVQ